jgi:hypothetical protein
MGPCMGHCMGPCMGHCMGHCMGPCNGPLQPVARTQWPLTPHSVSFHHTTPHTHPASRPCQLQHRRHRRERTGPGKVQDRRRGALLQRQGGRLRRLPGRGADRVPPESKVSGRRAGRRAEWSGGRRGLFQAAAGPRGAAQWEPPGARTSAPAARERGARGARRPPARRRPVRAPPCPTPPARPAGPGPLSPGRSSGRRPSCLRPLSTRRPSGCSGAAPRAATSAPSATTWPRARWGLGGGPGRRGPGRGGRRALRRLACYRAGAGAAHAAAELLAGHRAVGRHGAGRRPLSQEAGRPAAGADAQAGRDRWAPAPWRAGGQQRTVPSTRRFRPPRLAASLTAAPCPRPAPPPHTNRSRPLLTP